MQTFESWFKIPVLTIVLQALFFTSAHGYNNLGLIEILNSGIIYGFFARKINGIK